MKRLIENTIARIETSFDRDPVDRPLVSTAYLQLTSIATTSEELRVLRMLRDAATPDQVREAVAAIRHSFCANLGCRA